MQLRTALKRHFGHDTFRGKQEEVCRAILSEKDVLAVFPTGAGKSLCYQLPAVLLPGVTIVLSPLISLMQDQVMQLQRKGIAATYLSSSLSKQHYHERLELLRHGSYKLVYCAPEQLSNAQLVRVLQKITLSLVVIDEAHCISEWGHDFRPHYREIAQSLKTLTEQRVPCAAFTGTATPQTQQDIISVLQLIDPHVFTQTLFRPNLTLSVLPVSSRAAKEVVLLSLIYAHQNDPTIIYCSTRAQTEYCVSLLLRAFGTEYPCAAYHAGMTAEERTAVQQLFIYNKISCIAATSAFGMGVDKPDVACVIHYQIPGSIAQYVQEVGRAGRGGGAAACYLLQLSDDESIQERMAEQSSVSDHKRQQFLDLVQYAQRTQCRHQQLSAYFSEELSICEHSCDVCKNMHFSTLKHADFVSEKQLRSIEHILQICSQLSCQAECEPEYILTEQQVWWLSLLDGYDKERLQRVPGIGTGWIERWHQQFLEIHDKIHAV